MKVIILSKALVVGVYQKKCEEIAALGVELLVLVPPSWREPRVGATKLERRFTSGYRMETLPIVLNGQHHLHFYRGLRNVLERERPDVLHIDEESFNLATFQAMRAGIAVGARCCFYNYANIERHYPPPFNLFERYNFRHAAHGIACNQEAATIIRRHGFDGPLSIIPQFGVDPAIFAPVDSQPTKSTFTVGYLGRLVPEKGLLDLVEALCGTPPAIRLLLVGDGSQRSPIERRVAELGLHDRVTIQAAVGSAQVPETLRSFDVLVLPSRTRPNWKEQFGRVLVEAMSCGIPVLGSNSGEIPNVIGDAGIIFPEGDVAALRTAIVSLANAPERQCDLAKRGRERVLAHFTQRAIAERFVAVYEAMLNYSEAQSR
jgi:glycosyltransferase involved in cell wall biosynthesis